MRHDLKIGGGYTAVDNGDGTFNIMDVPVFCEIPPGVKRNKKYIGREWLQAALMKSKEREVGGHLPPVHVYHSDEVAVKPRYAGKMRQRDVRESLHEGQMKWTTFVDILGMPAAVFNDIKQGFLPYRSVEIHNWDKPEIDSLALMPTDVPFFRMPMLTIGAVLKSEAEIFADKTTPAYACRIAKAPAMAVLFRFLDKKEEDEEVTEDAEGGNKPESEEAVQAKDADALNTPPEADKIEKVEPEVMDDDPGPVDSPEDVATEEEEESTEEIFEEDETSSLPQEETAQGVDLSPVLSGVAAANAMLKQLMSRLGPMPAPPDKTEAVNGLDLMAEAQYQFSDEEDNLMGDNKNTSDKGKGGAVLSKDKVVTMTAGDLESVMMKATEAAVLKATTPLVAELNTLKAERQEEKKAGKVSALFRSAKDTLLSERCQVDAELEKHLMRCAEVGEDFLKDQVALLKSRLPKDAPPDGETFEQEALMRATEGVQGETVAKFAEEHQGDQKVASWAREQAVHFAAYQKASGSDMTLEEWLKSNWRSEHMHETNKV